MAIASLSLEKFQNPRLTEENLLARLAWLRDVVAPRLDRFLGYYRNYASELAESLPCPGSALFSVRPFRQFQEIGLPARITGFKRSSSGASTALGAIDTQRK